MTWFEHAQKLGAVQFLYEKDTRTKKELTLFGTALLTAGAAVFFFWNLDSLFFAVSATAFSYLLFYTVLDALFENA